MSSLSTQESNDLVYGFCRDIYKSFSSNIAYYSIQPAIVDICIAFYFINLKLGDRVKLVDGKTGIIRYIGYLSLIDYEVIGIELDEWSLNTKAGTVKAEAIFTALEGRGYFIRRRLIEDVNPLFFQVGDRIKLFNGRTGVVRYIGHPTIAEEELVGLELDTWSANAGDGSIQGKEYFTASPGRGYFARVGSIEKKKIQQRITKGAYARLKGLIRKPNFNGKTVKIVSYVEKQGRWKVKLLHAKQDKKYLGVREENLDLILDWEPSDTRYNGLTRWPSIGDRVKTWQGKYGVVKYCGHVEFSMRNEIYFGLELESKDPDGHNGIVRNKKYYEVADGHGDFFRLQDLTENLGSARFSRNANIRPNIGDHISTKSGMYGVVKYYGDVEFSLDEYIGLELEKWNPNGHNGTVRDKQYFETNDGYGYFVRSDSLWQILKRVCDAE